MEKFKPKRINHDANTRPKLMFLSAFMKMKLDDDNEQNIDGKQFECCTHNGKSDVKNRKHDEISPAFNCLSAFQLNNISDQIKQSDIDEKLETFKC